MRGLNYIILILVASIGVISCKSQRNLTYFNDLPNEPVITQAISEAKEFRVKPDDVIKISVSTLSSESNTLFNTGILTTPNAVAGSGNSSGVNALSEGYLVDQNGFIHFPGIGDIKVEGLTREEVRVLMVDKITKFVKDPIVNVKFVNLRFTVIGEVNSPGVLNIIDKKTNILEAVGLAGGMNDNAKRNDVLLIRELEGQRKYITLDFTTKNLFNSPYFQLEQNDVIYVRPSNAKLVRNNETLQYVGLFTGIISSLTIMVLTIRNFK